MKILLSSFPTGCLYVSDELLIINQKNFAVHVTCFGINLNGTSCCCIVGIREMHINMPDRKIMQVDYCN